VGIALHAFHFKKRDVVDETPTLLSKLDTMIRHDEVQHLLQSAPPYRESPPECREIAVILCEWLLSPGR